MLKKVADEIVECYEHASTCRERAEAAADPETKRDFLELERSWLFLARSLEFTERLDAFANEARINSSDRSNALEQRRTKARDP